MRLKDCFILVSAVLAMALIPAATLFGQTVVASEDFDGGAVNLINGFDPGTQNITIIPFTRFGVFSMGEFNAGNQAPFALADDSVSNVSGGGAFPGDSEGIFGQNRNVDDHFFAVVSASSFNIDPEDLVGSWTFDTSSAATSPLQLKIDMGQLSNDNFDGVPPENTILFEYRFNGVGGFVPAFSLAATELVDSGFSYRLFDAGTESIIDFFEDGSHMGLSVTDKDVTKTLADSGAIADNTILDKTPAMGAGAGMLDTFSVDLAGSGNTIEIRMSAEFSFEAFAFDNIQICTEDGKVLLGDVNLDGSVDLQDVAPFVNLITSGMFQAEGDINMDGVVNLQDVAPFVMLLTGG